MGVSQRQSGARRAVPADALKERAAGKGRMEGEDDHSFTPLSVDMPDERKPLGDRNELSTILIRTSKIRAVIRYIKAFEIRKSTLHG